MSNKDTVLTKLSHEDNAKSVHIDAKKSLADHGSYDPTLRILEEIKEVPELDNMKQKPALSIVTPGYPQIFIKSEVSAEPGPNSANPAKTAAGAAKEPQGDVLAKPYTAPPGVAKGHV